MSLAAPAKRRRFSNSDSISFALENFACSHAATASFSALGSGTGRKKVDLQPKEPIVRETKWLPHSLLDREGSRRWDRRTSNERHKEMTEVTKAE